jgi:undecaprenyl-diphosphatase
MNSTLETWNQASFLALNAGFQPSPLIVTFAKVLAQGAVYLVMAALVLGWVRQGKGLRFALLDATFAAFLGLGIAVSMTMIWYHPRPFEIGLGLPLLDHAADASFPSDHGTLLFALAFSLLAGAQRLWGLGFLVLAIGVAWARIYLGVHFPLDMIGAVGVAALSCTLVRAIGSVLHGKVYLVLNAIYEFLLRQLHLPKPLFPRDL